MSNITLIKVKIKNANPELLKQVVDQLCKEYGGTATNSIRDYYGNQTKVEQGFTCTAFPYGVGFVVEKGEVSVKGDFYGSHGSATQLQNKLTQNYTAQANIASLKALGFQTFIQKVGEKLLIRAQAW